MGCKLSLPFLPAWSSWGLARLEAEGAGPGAGEESVKQYSWDRLRVEVDITQYVIDGQEGGEVVRRPGTIAGQQFQIKNSSDCCIFVYDWANTVTIDDCKNCKIFIGAVKTSVFMRDCNNCVLVASCGQLRLRDCVKVDMFLCVNSQPIIEASSGVVVGCLQYSYHALPAHMESAGVTPWNNYWSQVYDFTPVQGETNWKKAGRMFKVEDSLPLPSDIELIKELGINNDPQRSIVPLTTGLDGKGKILDDENFCLILIHNCESKEGIAASSEVLSCLRKLSAGLDIVRTARINVRSEDTEGIFGDYGKDWAAQFSQGTLLAFHISGPGYNGELDLNKLISPGVLSLVHLTENIKHVQGLFHLVDIQRGF